MSSNELDSIKQDLSKIRSRYDAVIAGFEELRKLSPEKYKQSALKEGLVLKAAKNAESILRYVCKASKVNVTVGQNKAGTPVFSDYIYHAYSNRLINDRLKSEFEHIRNIRNISAHTDGDETFNLEHEELSIHKAEVIEDALTYITDWFFSQFLKNNYPDLSLRTSIKKDEPVTYQKYEPITPKKNTTEPEKRTNSNKTVDQTNKIKSKNIKYISLSILLLVLIISIFFFLNGKISKQNQISTSQNTSQISELTAQSELGTKPATAKQNEKYLKKIAFEKLQDYYDSLASHTFIASDFFDDDIVEYKALWQSDTSKDIEPQDIMNFRVRDKYEIKPDFIINNNYLKSSSTIKSYPSWIYTCNSDELFENVESNKKMTIEFSLNADGKFKSLKENYVEDDFEGS